ncbi:hypothetical protein FHR81_002367 [Actinoalloteichus hoggarensis]|uniref:Uncharacterized protein n=1 Tax=Actinoalloteichus hoggarensis TaxID=1470176 RepID=A0A221W6Y2_9PSEU|nr:hypothetical protein AHOG_18855 [Actinoalloteichus hoggarensis]MBB5921329.1 hypothetical protein [Actinoalloteichus hoggarensis]
MRSDPTRPTTRPPVRGDRASRSRCGSPLAGSREVALPRPSPPGAHGFSTSAGLGRPAKGVVGGCRPPVLERSGIDQGRRRIDDEDTADGRPRMCSARTAGHESALGGRARHPPTHREQARRRLTQAGSARAGLPELCRSRQAVRSHLARGPRCSALAAPCPLARPCRLAAPWKAATCGVGRRPRGTDAGTPRRPPPPIPVPRSERDAPPTPASPDSSRRHRSAPRAAARPAGTPRPAPPSDERRATGGEIAARRRADRRGGGPTAAGASLPAAGERGTATPFAGPRRACTAHDAGVRPRCDTGPVRRPRPENRIGTGEGIGPGTHSVLT